MGWWSFSVQHLMQAEHYLEDKNIIKIVRELNKSLWQSGRHSNERNQQFRRTHLYSELLKKISIRSIYSLSFVMFMFFS